MLIVDAHEDIAWNVLTFGRDYTHSAEWIRSREAGTLIPSQNGNTLLGREDWLAGRVAVIFATLFASPARRRLGDWDTQYYSDREGAHIIASRQLDAYARLAEDHPQFRRITAKAELADILGTWEDSADDAQRQIGLVTLMEGADPIRQPEEVEEWHRRGVRIIGPAWVSTRYAGGTHEPGPLTVDGLRLLELMSELGMILDLSHLAEEAYYQATEVYQGVMIASHSNPRLFLPTDRGLSDEMIALLAERKGVVGIVPFNAFLKPGWKKGDPREEVHLAEVASAIDHICQVTGSADHVGIGTDFDGGFGVESVPVGIDSIADLVKLEEPLRQRGYTTGQIDGIFGGNWLRILQAGLP